MNKSMQPCDAGIKKRRAVQGQASLFTNHNISKSTPSIRYASQRCYG